MKFAELVNTINKSPSGAFCSIRGYQSETGNVSNILGHLGYSYKTAKDKAIAALKLAIDNGTLESIAITGTCYKDGDEWNPRKKSCPAKEYSIIYSADEVNAKAKEILDSWENPKERANNNVNLSEKENGLAFNTETNTFSFCLLVERQEYIEEASNDAKEALGIVDKVQIKAPETKLSDAIRKQIEKPIRTITISSGKFSEIKMSGVSITSNEIMF